VGPATEAGGAETESGKEASMNAKKLEFVEGKWRDTVADPCKCGCSTGKLPVCVHVNALLKSLPTDQDRLDAMAGICRYCGRVGDNCHCWNDE
jgi:hypothetical protein